MSEMEKWKHLRIPFEDIKNGTKNFLKEIGRGGYGSVYEGKLFVNGEYLKVAVKRSSDKHGQGLKEFWNEIDLLSGKKHENLVTLVGYCDEENEKIIVYEYAERGSLDYYFRFRNTSYTLTWIQRLKIVVDVARGLDHLHNHLPKKQVIIHRDIKSSNILIDQEWVAKVSDFGLSKSTSSGLDRSTVVTYACGTPGYVEPELKKFFLANKKADVYSFGMVLCEVLCGTLCKSKVDEDKILSAEVFEEYYIKDKLDKIIDPCLKEQMNPNALSKFSVIAYKCLRTREQRPPIDFVKKELEETLKIQVFHSTPAHSMQSGIKGCRRIPFAEIKDATKDFKNIIGRGGYGIVYKGELSVHGIYMKVAVKRSKEEFGQGIKEFLTEIQLLSDIHHENINPLVGYCDEGKEKILVSEYAEHGSLDMHISTLTWLERLKIVVDIARGLDHLHNHLRNNQAILHRDIKCSNILLDKMWVPKICDFGLSKLTLSGLGRSMVISQVCGTFTYLEPEYFQTGIQTKKTDVYSFGMVLLEVLTGRLSYIRDQDGILLMAEVAKEYYVNDKLDMIIDPSLRKQMSLESFNKFSTIVYNCLQDREQRPLMDIVKRELEETLKMEVLRWRNFISKHWFILDVENLSPKIDNEMPAEETEGLENLSISCEENITDDESTGKKRDKKGM